MSLKHVTATILLTGLTATGTAWGESAADAGSSDIANYIHESSVGQSLGDQHTSSGSAEDDANSTIANARRTFEKDIQSEFRQLRGYLRAVHANSEGFQFLSKIYDGKVSAGDISASEKQDLVERLQNIVGGGKDGNEPVDLTDLMATTYYDGVHFYEIAREAYETLDNPSATRQDKHNAMLDIAYALKYLQELRHHAAVINAGYTYKRHMISKELHEASEMSLAELMEKHRE